MTIYIYFISKYFYYIPIYISKYEKLSIKI